MTDWKQRLQDLRDRFAKRADLEIEPEIEYESGPLSVLNVLLALKKSPIQISDYDHISKDLRLKTWPDRVLYPILPDHVITVAKNIPTLKFNPEENDCDDFARRLWCLFKVHYPLGAFAYAVMDKVPYLEGRHVVNIGILKIDNNLEILIAEPQSVGGRMAHLIREPTSEYVLSSILF